MPISTDSTNEGGGIIADQDPSDELRLSRDRIAELESAGFDLVAQNENDAADTLKEIQDKIGRIENSVAWLQQGQLRCDPSDELRLSRDRIAELESAGFDLVAQNENDAADTLKEIQDKIGRIENSVAWLQQGQLRCDRYKLWFATDPEEEQQFKEIQDKIGKIENSIARLQEGQLKCGRV
uniref:Tektin n=1 Tax=Globodera pallida TaxID=36090 RepID=A0A183CGF2_GLOPA